MSVEGLEPSTNGLKGRYLQISSSIQWPALMAMVHWTHSEPSTLETF